MKSRSAPDFEIALIHVGLGNRDQAFGHLERAYIKPDPYLLYIKVDPNMDSLRSDPRFANLTRKLGLS